MPEVRFSAKNAAYGDIFDVPKPASMDIPDWYVSQEKYTHGERGVNERGGFNQTVKSCSPVYDAITAGYLFYLPCDINVTLTPEQERVDANMTSRSFEHLEFHPSSQISKWSFDKDYYEAGFVGKFLTGWVPRLPEGYSLMVMHPMWREELPYTILPGIIDYDSYASSINFFFLLKKSFEGILRCGSPIGQVIPFKREDWSHSIDSMSDHEYFVGFEKDRRFIENAYKKNHLSKKVWD